MLPLSVGHTRRRAGGNNGKSAGRCPQGPCPQRRSRGVRQLMRYPPMPVEHEYQTHKPYLEERFGAGAVTPLSDTEVASRPARTYAFAWPEGEREALLFRTK